MKSKHSLRNYLLAPLIICVNPVIALLVFITKQMNYYSNKILNRLPKFDLYYTEEDIAKQKEEVISKYLKLVKKENVR